MAEAIYHGHSHVELETENGSILIDPFISNNPSAEITKEEIAKKNILAIIITHGHADHIGDTIFLAQETNALVISTFEIITYLHEQGLQNTSAHGIGGKVDYEYFSVKFTHAVHGGAILDTGRTCSPAGVVISTENRKCYHAGDTALISDFRFLKEENITVAFLPIGDRYTMGVEDAIKATEMIQPKYVIPIHYNTRKEIEQDPIEFSRRVMLQNHAVPKVLRAGQSLILE